MADEPTPNPDDAGEPDVDVDVVVKATSREQELAQEAASYRRRYREAQRQLEAATAAAQTESEKAIADARKDERSKVEAEYKKKLVAADVRARAAGRLADPADATRYLDLDELADVDPAALPAKIDKALGDLVEARPYLAPDAGGGDPAGFELVSAGARSTPKPGDGAGGKGGDPDKWLRDRRAKR